MRRWWIGGNLGRITTVASIATISTLAQSADLRIGFLGMRPRGRRRRGWFARRSCTGRAVRASASRHLKGCDLEPRVFSELPSQLATCGIRPGGKTATGTISTMRILTRRGAVYFALCVAGCRQQVWSAPIGGGLRGWGLRSNRGKGLAAIFWWWFNPTHT